MSANFLICAPSTMPRMAVGSEFRECAKCRAGIMIGVCGK